jgi:OOP family OmpA-OmpF porin
MKKIMFLFVFALLLGATALQAQAPDRSHGIGLRYLGANYQFPISNDLVDDDFDYGIEIEYTKYFNNYVGLSIPFKFHRARLPRNNEGTFIRNSGVISLDALMQIRFFDEPHFVVPYIFGGFGVATEAFRAEEFQAPVGLGLNFRLAENFYLSTKAEYRFSLDNELRDNLQLLAGFHILVGPDRVKGPEELDTDMDGINDAEDLCPLEPGLPALNGCPDADGDGIADGSDECPTVAGTAAFNGCPDTDGDGIADPKDECPEEAGPAANNGCPILDADGDGVNDDVDACPDQPGPTTTNGCPDRDGDGVADKDDACPDTAGIARFNGCPDTDGDGIQDKDDACPEKAGPAQYNGCPDSDGDGIADNVDACPTVPGVESLKGCPELKQEEKETLQFAATAIQFESGKATFKPESYPILDQIVEILTKYQGYNVRIEGHTDSVGSRATNQKLSEDRARACYDYFVSKGIPSIRQSFEGFGEEKPVATNQNRAGRAKNRRVEFDVYIK